MAMEKGINDQALQLIESSGSRLKRYEKISPGHQN